MDFLTASNRKGLGDNVKLFDDGTLNAENKNIIVVGGGDTAMDCVRTAVRQKAKSVKCLYRRDRENMPGSAREVGNAIEEGVEFLWLSNPNKFIGTQKVKSVEVSKMKLGEPDESGRRKPIVMENSKYNLKADMVIKALGFDPEDLPKLFNSEDLAVSRWGTIKIDLKTMQTNLPGVFAAGDIVRGASLVVWAVRDGRDAAVQIEKYLNENKKKKNRLHEFIFKKIKKLLQENFSYDQSFEHDACGVGVIASLDGKKRRQVVEYGIESLKAVWHRGAVDADGKSGDGAGICVEVPKDFFLEKIKETGHEHKGEEEICVGMIFLPKNEYAMQERAKTIVEQILLENKFYIYGWRQVPVNPSVLGITANSNRPEITQVIFKSNKLMERNELERLLFVSRKKILKITRKEQINDFYICSLSSRSIIYKGMFLTEALSDFYTDLNDKRFISRFAIFHQRFSTNTFPSWKLAQPFRCLAHNGEINTLKGNINWMKIHEQDMSSNLFQNVEDLKPVITPGNSDSTCTRQCF